MDENYSKLVDMAYNMHVSKKFEDAKNVYEKLLSINPNDINVLYLYAQLQSQMNNYDIAIELFSKLYNKTKFEDSLLCIAKVYMYKKDYKQAINYLNRIRLKNLVVIKLTGLCYLKLTMFKEAISNYEIVVASGESTFADYFNLSIAYFSNSELDKALMSGLNAQKLDKNNLDILIHLSQIYEQLGDYENAIDQLFIVLKKKENTHTLYKLGILYFKINNIDKALEYFNRVLELEPDNQSAILKLKELNQKIEEQLSNANN